jgi:hypothetical protein
MRDREPTPPSAPTSQFQAFVNEAGSEQRNPRVSTSTIALIGIVVVVILVAIIAATAL